VTRRLTRPGRLLLALVLVGIVAGVAATVAHALAFDDANPCHDTQPVFVCPQGTVAASYSIQLVGRGGCGPALPYQYRVLSGALPPGLSLSSGGSLSGTPSASGTYSFWLELSDQNPPSQSWCNPPQQAQRPFSLTVAPGLRITTNSLPQTASVGVAYSATLDAQIVTNLNPLTGTGASGVTWTIASGALPPGLSLGSGVISGTPTAEGSFTFQVRAAIDASRTSIQTYSLTVRQPLAVTASKPLATAPLPTLWEVGVPFSAKLTPSGGNGTYTIALADGTLPAGLAVAADGTISGTPHTAGVSRATIRTTDGEGRTVDYVASFGIANKVSVSTLLLRPGKVGKLYRAKLSSTGGLTPRIWKVTSGQFPKGLRLDRATGIVSGIPRKAGSFTLTFQVTDGLKVTATKTFKIVVAETKKPKKKP